MRAVLFALAVVASSHSAVAAESPVVVFETTKGKIVIQLDGDKAPISTKNMLDYIDAKHYDGTIFHRVIPGFMIQGGGYTKDLKEKAVRAPIKNEATNKVPNKRGTVAMARTGIVDSATAQFFVNVADNEFLNHRGTSPSEYGYAVFGKVLEGMEVVDAIVNTPRHCPSNPPEPCDPKVSGGMRDVPKEPVVITKAYRKK